MKALLVSGFELVTTDAVAEALLDYVVTVPINQPPARVEVPVLRNGVAETATLVLTPTSPLVVASVDMIDVDLEGASDASAILRRRAARLAGFALGQVADAS